MNKGINQIMLYVGAIGSAVTCVIMVLFEMICMHVPALVSFVLALFLLIFVIAENSRKSAKMN